MINVYSVRNVVKLSNTDKATVNTSNTTTLIQNRYHVQVVLRCFGPPHPCAPIELNSTHWFLTCFSRMQMLQENVNRMKDDLLLVYLYNRLDILHQTASRTLFLVNRCSKFVNMLPKQCFLKLD